MTESRASESSRANGKCEQWQDNLASMIGKDHLQYVAVLNIAKEEQ